MIEHMYYTVNSGYALPGGGRKAMRPLSASDTARKTITAKTVIWPSDHRWRFRPRDLLRCWLARIPAGASAAVLLGTRIRSRNERPFLPIAGLVGLVAASASVLAAAAARSRCLSSSPAHALIVP